MFNLVVSGNGTSWETDQLMRFPVERFTQYDGHEAGAVSLDVPSTLTPLEAVPTLLMYERGVIGPNSELVRYGFATEIRRSGNQVVFRFAEHGHLERSVIEEFSERLGMVDFELCRTHWAVKDGDIPNGVLVGMKTLFVGERQNFKVFYAWQSDHASSSHKRFIRDALDRVAERIKLDPSCAFKVEIDQDTQGIPGLCDIPATILNKIASSDAFVADLTYVAKSTIDGLSEDKSRYCSNPNVLFELGFAFHAIGWERLICVMNEKHGPSTEQIFDLDHRRHPIGYLLPNDKQNREEELERLSQSLEYAVRSVLLLGLLADQKSHR